MPYDSSTIPLHLPILMEELKRNHYTLINSPGPAHGPGINTPSTLDDPSTHPHTYNLHNNTTSNVTVSPPPLPLQGYAPNNSGFDRNGPPPPTRVAPIPIGHSMDDEPSHSLGDLWSLEQYPSKATGDACMQPIGGEHQESGGSLSTIDPVLRRELLVERRQALAQAHKKLAAHHHDSRWLVQGADSYIHHHQLTSNRAAEADCILNLYKGACDQPPSSSFSPGPSRPPLMESTLWYTPISALPADAATMGNLPGIDTRTHHSRSASDPHITSMNMARSRDYLAQRASFAAPAVRDPISQHERAHHGTSSPSQPAQTIVQTSTDVHQYQQQQALLLTQMVPLDHRGTAEGWAGSFGIGMTGTRDLRACPVSQRSNYQSDGQAALQSSAIRRLNGLRESAQLVHGHETQYHVHNWYSKLGMQSSSSLPVGQEEYGQETPQQSAGVAYSSDSPPARQAHQVITECTHELTNGIWDRGAHADASVPPSSNPTMQNYGYSLQSGVPDDTMTLQSLTPYTNSPADNLARVEASYALPKTHSPHPLSTHSSPYSVPHSPFTHSGQSPFAQHACTSSPPIMTPPMGGISQARPIGTKYPHKCVTNSHHGSLTTSPMIRPPSSSLSVSPAIQSAPLFSNHHYYSAQFPTPSATFPTPDIPNYSPPSTAASFPHARFSEQFPQVQATGFNVDFNPTSALSPGDEMSGWPRALFSDIPSLSDPSHGTPGGHSSPETSQPHATPIPTPSSLSGNEEDSDGAEDVEALPDDVSEQAAEVESVPASDTLVSLPSIPRATVDQVTAFIERAFPIGTPKWARRRRALRMVLFSDWKARDIKEPSRKLLLEFVDTLNSPTGSSSTSSGAGTSSQARRRRSRVSPTSASAVAKNKQRWRCGFYLNRTDEAGKQIRCPCGSVRTVQALEHVRRHIKLEPFVCEGEPCPESSTGCGARYSSRDPLRKHRSGKVTCDTCLRGVLPGNMKRHLENNCRE